MTKDKKNTDKKRTMLQVEPTIHELINLQKEQAGRQTMQTYLTQICNEIVEGEHDELINYSKKDKNIPLYRSDFEAVKEYLEGSSDNVTEMIKKVVLKKSEEEQVL